MMLFGALDGAIPLLLQRIFNDIFQDHDRRMLWVLVGLIVGLALLRAPFGFLHRYLSASVGLRVVRDLRNDVHRHLLTLSDSFFARRSSGDLMSGVAADTLFVRNALVEASVTVVRGGFRVVALVAAAFYLDPTLAAVSLVGLPLSLYPLWRFGTKVRRYSRTGQAQTGGLTALLQESILGHRVVQAFGREAHEQRRFEAENERLTRTWEKAEKYASLAFPTTEVCASAAIALVVVYGGLSVITGARQQGDFLAFITGMFLLYDPLKNLGRVHSTIQMGVAAGERLFELLDAAPDIVDRPGAVAFGGGDAGGAHPRRVPRTSPSATPRRPGESCDEAALALDGRLADGRAGAHARARRDVRRRQDARSCTCCRASSTRPAGAVLVGGVDLRDYRVAVAARGDRAGRPERLSLQRHGARQHPLRQARGERRGGRGRGARAPTPTSSSSGCPRATTRRSASRGCGSPAASARRIAIARALLKNAPILILDEATAALDSDSERLVQAAIERLMLGRTTLVIAHRLSTVRRADAIAVIEHGRVVELGTHDELIARGGAYERLHRIQFAGR